ncbi:hypothetical protein CHS0354_019599 [Potamilus streckersoni]|uniref:Uncharacterized protein n=1 Tax=Potamilus streckersoni TaxID=2493646 RepID=A0AAE0TA15_9BIVA|nr:hypothetical protein CHS0354_019599 [Potamilus streckersoni]
MFSLRLSQKTRRNNLNSKPPVNSDNISKDKPRMNAAYNDGDEEFPYTKKHASMQLQNLDKETETYAVPIKGEGSFGTTVELCNGTTTNEDESTIVVVQNGTISGQEVNNIKYRNDHLGNVHKRPSFYLEPRDLDSISMSDKVNFYNEIQD